MKHIVANEKSIGTRTTEKFGQLFICMCLTLCLMIVMMSLNEIDSVNVVQSSQPFLGKLNNLVICTNCEMALEMLNRLFIGR
jgi:lipid-A-disaccharide synthase-like uncharacterized protein